MQSAKTVYLVATPIGNLTDISQRAIDILCSADVILAEDTRHSKKLLQHIDSKVNMLSMHDHNEREKSEQILDSDYNSIAVISDAGTPLISDPGYTLVKLAHAKGIKVIPIPGACAAISALSASGIATDSFMFCGFLPSTETARQKKLLEFKDISASLIFYEAPHRILASVLDIEKVLGKRRLCIAREISKQYEQIVTSDIYDVIKMFDSNEIIQKGEFVIVVSGASKDISADEIMIKNVLSELMQELSLKQAVSITVKITGAAKNIVYDLALSLKE